jgi:hypothetical protein
MLHSRPGDVASMQVVEELFTYWNLDSTDEACEELEEALIVSAHGMCTEQLSTHACRTPAQPAA